MLDQPQQFQNNNSSTQKIFGIIGLVMACFSLVFSLIPCVGFYAIVPGFIASVFCVVSFVGLRQRQSATTIPLVGMIVGVVAIGIGTYQYITYKEVFKAAKDLERSVDSVMVKKVVDSVDAAIEKEIREDSISKAQKDSIW